MKKTFYLLGLLVLSSCGTSDNSNLVSSNQLQQPNGFVDTRSAEEPGLYLPPVGSPNARLSATDQKAHLKKELELRKRLQAEAILPIPTNEADQPLTQQEAHNRYLSFLDSHQKDEILPLFQQRYARVLLNEYGLLKGDNYNLVLFYVDQLITSQSLDFTTITEGLTTIKGHFPAEAVTSRIESVLAAAQQRQNLEGKVIAKLEEGMRSPASVKTDGGLRKEFWSDFYQRELTRLKASSVSQTVQQLKALQNG